MEKTIGLHVREAVKGWTGDAYATYFEAWDAAQEAAKNHDTVVLGEKKTQAQLDEAKAAEMERRKNFLEARQLA